MKRSQLETITKLANKADSRKLNEKNVEQVDITKLKRFRIERARDLVVSPLTPKEFLKRPFLARSRWLVSAYDFDQCRQIKFYLGNPSDLRVALYVPESKLPKWTFPRPFGPTQRERQLLIDSLAEVAMRGGTDLKLRVFCDGLKLLRAS